MVLTSRRIIYAPDGALNLIPLSSLLLHVDEADSLDALFLHREVDRVPSATVLAWLRRNRGEQGSDDGDDDDGSSTLLAYAGGTDEEGNPLKGALAEVRLLNRRFQNVELRIADSTEESILDPGLLADYGALHLAAHARVVDQDPWRSAILLGPLASTTGDELSRGTSEEEELSSEAILRGERGLGTNAPELQASQIAVMELSARLAVLSACESAGGRVLSGEGVQGLSSAFLSAGVPAVVATLWPVDDVATARLMELFYDGLARGQSTSASLRGAQKVLRSEPATAHPFYWSAFVLVGDGVIGLDLRQKGVSGTMLLAIAGGGILVLLLALGTRALRSTPDRSPV